MQFEGLHAQAPAPTLMSAALTALMFRLIAKLPELFGIVQNMSKPFFLLWGRLGSLFRLRGFWRRDAAEVEAVAQLVNRQPRASLADRHCVEIGAIPFLVG